MPSSLRTDCLITLYRVVYTSLFSPRKSTNKRITFPLFAVEIMRILLPHNCGYLTNNKTPYQVGILPPQFAICIKNEPFICRCTHFSAYKARWFYAQAVSNNLFTSHPHPCNPRHGVTFQKLRRYLCGTSDLLQPFPCFFVYLLRLQCASVTLFS